MSNKLNIISTLPPQGGISDYTLCLLKILDTFPNLKIYFWGFESLYPPFTKKNIYNDIQIPEFKNIEIKNVLSWWNPISPFILAFSLKSNIVNFQYWSPGVIHWYYIIALICKLLSKTIIITVHNPQHHEKEWQIVNNFKIINKILSYIIYFFINRFMNLGNIYLVHNTKSLNSLLNIYPNIKEKNITLIKEDLNLPELLNFENNKTSNVFIVDFPIVDLYPNNKNIDKLYALNKLNLPKDKKIILFFGNVRQYKGIEELIMFFEKLNYKKYHLVIAGRVWFEMKETLDEYLKKLKNKNYTLYNKFISSEMVELLMKSADCLILNHKNFNSASGITPLAIFYNTKIIANKSLNNEIGIDLFFTNFNELTEEKLDNFLNKINTNKSKIISENKKNIIKQYKNIFNYVFNTPK